jgi:sulfur relay (sulfurtransferase) complex TusBCD TusD component (DsrE family)
MAAVRTRQWDLLLVLTAPPHQNDVVTSALRMAQATLDRGGSVRLWACGYATMLTQTTQGDTKLANVRRPEVDYPSPAAVAKSMIAANEGRFGWIGCTACSAERGATQHIPEIRLRSPGRFAATIAAARTTVFIGGA